MSVGLLTSFVCQPDQEFARATFLSDHPWKAEQQQPEAIAGVTDAVSTRSAAATPGIDIGLLASSKTPRANRQKSVAVSQYRQVVLLGPDR